MTPTSVNNKSNVSILDSASPEIKDKAPTLMEAKKETKRLAKAINILVSGLRRLIVIKGGRWLIAPVV